ncbi:putative cystathionine beta-synthase [Geopyxis carbonaria]|nr:putative cystathionine beta-synthase [Geopyxis carbonaria]
MSVAATPLASVAGLPSAHSGAASKFRGATVEDLDLPPALSIHPTTPISTAVAMSYDRDYSQLTVISPTTRSLLGYVSSEALKSAPADSEVVGDVMNRFDRRRSKGYKVITPETPLEELQSFFEGGEEFAVVTDAVRRFVLGVATKGDLEEFVKRRPF